MRLAIKNFPFKFTKKDILEIFNEYGSITDIIMKKNPDGRSNVCYIGYINEECANEAIKYRHMSFLKNKRIKVEPVYDEKLSNLRSEFKKLTDREESKPEVIEIKSKSIYIRNLPEITTEENLREHFSGLEIEKIKIIHNEENKFIGHALITLRTFDDSKSAYLNKNDFLGRKLNIGFYNEQIEKKTYFSQLFFNFDTVIESICKEENVTRAELLDLNDKELGTRVSLLETHLVEQTRMFLEKNDIFLDNLTGKLNKKTLIVRNFNLLSMDFKNCNVKIAPSKTLALLEFNTKKDAKIVFDELNYKRVKDKAIFVDYLPISLSEKKEIKLTNKLIIKNVPFQAEKKELLKLFSSQVKIKNIRLPKKRDGQHRGFCFLTLNTPDDAKIIFNYFGCNTHLYGRRLVIEPAEV